MLNGVPKYFLAAPWHQESTLGRFQTFSDHFRIVPGRFQTVFGLFRTVFGPFCDDRAGATTTQENKLRAKNLLAEGPQIFCESVSDDRARTNERKDGQKKKDEKQKIGKYLLSTSFTQRLYHADSCL